MNWYVRVLGARWPCRRHFCLVLAVGTSLFSLATMFSFSTTLRRRPAPVPDFHRDPAEYVSFNDHRQIDTSHAEHLSQHLPQNPRYNLDGHVRGLVREQISNSKVALLKDLDDMKKDPAHSVITDPSGGPAGTHIESREVSRSTPRAVGGSNSMSADDERTNAIGWLKSISAALRSQISSTLEERSAGKPDGRISVEGASAAPKVSSTISRRPTQLVRTLNDDKWEAVHRRMIERENWAEKVCKMSKFRSPGISDNLIIDRKHSVVWCPVFKAGSTNWLNLLCDINDVSWTRSDSTPSCPIHALRSHFRRTFLDQVIPSRGTHFVIVRHPLERLLSAYRDKILAGIPQYNRKSSIIVSRQRRPSVHTAEPVRPAELSAVEALPSANAKKVALPSVDAVKVALPTFAEFLRSVAALDVIDEHWKPYYAMCTPCNTHYQLIGKFETLQEDQDYIMNVTGLARFGRLPRYSNYNRAGHSRDLLRKYYSQVTKNELLKVYKVYKLDFIMFNYTIKEYLDWVKPDDV